MQGQLPMQPPMQQGGSPGFQQPTYQPPQVQQFQQPPQMYQPPAPIPQQPQQPQMAPVPPRPAPGPALPPPGVVGAPGSRPPRKRALLIGINYIGSRNALKGCINDARRMRDLLVNLRYRMKEHSRNSEKRKKKKTSSSPKLFESFSSCHPFLSLSNPLILITKYLCIYFLQGFPRGRDPYLDG